MTDITTWSASEIVGAIRSRQTTCLEVTAALLTQAGRVNRELACFIDLDEGSAIERARSLDATHSRAPALFGVPFAHKDVFASVERLPSAGAAAVPLPWRARGSAVLERLSAAGGVPLGTLNLDQFGYAATGLNPDFGDVRNPWDPQRIAGGSSSGAAAAVAARAVPFAIGSDTGGSVRIPASLCGVVGLKPTFGRISRRGSLPLSYSQDTIGLLTRTVSDAALVLDALAGHDPLDAGSLDVPAPALHPQLLAMTPSLKGTRVGVDRHQLAASVDTEVQGAVEEAVKTFAALGAEIVDLDLSALAGADAAATVLTWAEVSAVHGVTFAKRREHYAATIRGRLDGALVTTGAEHVDALRYQGRALREFSQQVLSTVDLIATASTTRPAITLQAAHAADEEGVPASLEELRLNRPFSFLGLPAMSLPMGFGADDLPLGLQLVGHPWAEARLLECGVAYQAVTGWHLRSPSIAAAQVPGDRAASTRPGG